MGKMLFCKVHIHGEETNRIVMQVTEEEYRMLKRLSIISYEQAKGSYGLMPTIKVERLEYDDEE